MVKRNEYFPQSIPPPGNMLAEKLEEMGISPEEFADYANISEKTVNEIIVGKSAITPDIAVQFERITLIPAHFWLNSQRNYDAFIARTSQKKFTRTRKTQNLVAVEA